jgi:hypothetical protein
MIPQIKMQDEKPAIEGNFEFKFGAPVYNPLTYAPVIDITFKWCPEVSMEAQLALKDNEAIELIAEKLKQDFITHITTIKNK